MRVATTSTRRTDLLTYLTRLHLVDTKWMGLWPCPNRKWIEAEYFFGKVFCTMYAMWWLYVSCDSDKDSGANSSTKCTSIARETYDRPYILHTFKCVTSCAAHEAWCYSAIYCQYIRRSVPDLISGGNGAAATTNFLFARSIFLAKKTKILVTSGSIVVCSIYFAREHDSLSLTLSLAANKLS